MRIGIIFIVTSLAGGCATSKMVTYNITSEPIGAPVDVNGVNMGKTPTTAELECAKKWVGVMNSPDGWANATGKYVIRAYPPRGIKGQSQTKSIDPCQWKGKDNPSIQFDLGLEQVAPIQNIDITTNNNSSSIKKSLDALKILKKSGVISEQEYKTKVLELVQ